MPVFLCLWFPLDIRSQDSNINLQLVVSGYNIQSSNPYFEQKLFTGFSPGLELNIGKSNRISYSLGFRLFQDSILRPDNYTCYDCGTDAVKFSSEDFFAGILIDPSTKKSQPHFKFKTGIEVGWISITQTGYHANFAWGYSAYDYTVRSRILYTQLRPILEVQPLRLMALRLSAPIRFGYNQEFSVWSHWSGDTESSNNSLFWTNLSAQAALVINF